MRIYNQTITFDGTGGKQISVGPTRALKVWATPFTTNTHAAKVGVAGLNYATSVDAHVIKSIAKPTGADTQLDIYMDGGDLHGHNRVETGELLFDGATGDSVNVTVWEG